MKRIHKKDSLYCSTADLTSRIRRESSQAKSKNRNEGKDTKRKRDLIDKSPGKHSATDSVFKEVILGIRIFATKEIQRYCLPITKKGTFTMDKDLVSKECLDTLFIDSEKETFVKDLQSRKLQDC